MAKLTGYSLPAQFANRFDHAYVASDTKKWGCFGRDAGGAFVISGDGDESCADCLSQPNSTAGIVYFVTGVCHQAANRILWPSGVVVAAVRGYGWSSFMFNTYGKGTWPQLRHCGNLMSSLGTPPPSQRGSSVPLKGFRLFKRIADILTSVHESEAADPNPQDEFYALAEVQLGSDYDPRKLEAVAAVQQTLQARQRALAVQLQKREMLPERYFDLMTELQHDAAVKAESILGRVDFERLFGVSATAAPSLADREIFLAQHASTAAAQSPNIRRTAS